MADMFHIGNIEEYDYIKRLIHFRGYIDDVFKPGRPISWSLDYALSDEAA